MTLSIAGDQFFDPEQGTFWLPYRPGRYYLSDGTSWTTGAGTASVAYTTFKSAVVSNGFIYYDFTPPANELLFSYTDFNYPNASAGALRYTGDVVLVAAVGSPQATFSGYATILDNTPHSAAFNYYSASVGQMVHFQMTLTPFYSAPWEPDTFASSFGFSGTELVDFTQVVPEPTVSSLLSLIAGLLLVRSYRHRHHRQAAACCWNP
jgi:hypothetical protein